MINGFSKFRVELLEAAKVALANQNQNQGPVEGGGNVNVNGMGMVMTASDMRVRGGSSQVFGTGAGSGGSAEKVVGLAASDGSGKRQPGTKVCTFFFSFFLKSIWLRVLRFDYVVDDDAG